MSTSTVLNNGSAHPLFNRAQPVDVQVEEHLQVMKAAPPINMEKSVKELCNVIENNFKVTADGLRSKADELRNLADALDARADRIDNAAPEISKNIQDWMAYEDQGAALVDSLGTILNHVDNLK